MAYRHGDKAYSELLQVVHGDGVAEKVEQSILEHATVTVAARQWLVSWEGKSADGEICH